MQKQVITFLFCLDIIEDLKLNRRIWATPRNGGVHIKGAERASDWIKKGEEFYKTGHPQKATEAYTHAIRLEPKHAAAYFNRAVLLHRAGKSKEALKDFRSAARPGHSRAQKLLQKNGIQWE